jgi:hypothetical protein
VVPHPGLRDPRGKVPELGLLCHRLDPLRRNPADHPLTGGHDRDHQAHGKQYGGES